MIFPFSASVLITSVAGVFGNVFSAIPITLGGLGLGESIFAKFCIDLSARTAPFATIYLAFRVGMLRANLPGLMVPFFYNTQHQKNAE